VDSIIGHKFAHGKDMFKVHWSGYSKADDTWEPVENLSNCYDLVEAFMDKKAALVSLLLYIIDCRDCVCGKPVHHLSGSY